MSIRDTDHPYYCNDGNYRSNDCTYEYGSWSDFIDEMGDADEDYNYLVRWDWAIPNPDDYADNDVPSEQLKLYYVAQRKGDFSAAIVDVTPDDEPAITEWLRAKAEYVKKVWDPFL